MDYNEIFWDALIILVIIAITILLLASIIKVLFKDRTGEDLKMYLDFLKWATVSVALVMITNIVNSIIKDREAGLNELKQYDKYVDLIIKKDEIAKKWRLAQYYAAVMPSNKLRARWNDYYKIVEADYKDSIAQQQALIRTKDSLIKLQQTTGKKLDSALHEKIINVDSRIQNLNVQLNPNLNQGSAADSAAIWEERGFSFLFIKDVTSAIEAFTRAEGLFHGFHNVFEIRNYLINTKDLLQPSRDQAWKDAYKTILNNWAWHLNKEQIQRLSELSK